MSLVCLWLLQTGLKHLSILRNVSKRSWSSKRTCKQDTRRIDQVVIVDLTDRQRLGPCGKTLKRLLNDSFQTHWRYCSCLENLTVKLPVIYMTVFKIILHEQLLLSGSQQDLQKSFGKIKISYCSCLACVTYVRPIEPAFNDKKSGRVPACHTLGH